MSFPGGKSGAGVYQSIINQMPPHETYIEPFLGSGAIMRRKRPAECNIGIDIDPATILKFDHPEWIVIHDDGISYLEKRIWNGRELVYCDPPYLPETRRSRKQLYNYELSDDQHRILLSIIRKLPCMVMISGYASDLYFNELPNWRLVTFTGQTRGRPAIEHLWCNFPEPAALHDYRYLGSDFRHRERIGRKARRWRAKLDKLDPLERQAVLSACLATSSTIAGNDGRRSTLAIDSDAAASPVPAMGESALARSDDAGSRLAAPLAVFSEDGRPRQE